MGLNVLGYQADILGTNCNKLLKLKINVCVCVAGGGGGEGRGRGSRFNFSTCNHVRGAARRLLSVKKEILSLGLAWSSIDASCSREVVAGRRPHQDTRGIGHVWLPLSWPQFASTRPLDTLPVSHPLQLSTRGHLTPAFLALKTMFWRFCESCCLLARTWHSG